MRKLIPKAYRWFHSLIAQGQFVALGIALVALVSKVYHTLRPLCRVNYISSSLDVMMKEVEGAALGSNDENGYDLGMVISRDQTITAPKMTADKVTTTMKSEVGQEKKKFRTTITSTSIIEDIFAVPSGTKNKSKSVVNDIFSNDSRKQKSKQMRSMTFLVSKAFFVVVSICFT
ncbi:hypothetical protein NADFUDRAFT_48186 [Nadsonia fulvescens var. elongata DSM 6958]|uniref:Uncharacterized protein n=1 Tax=Nadsonia fulvescens var. elongata DSM 6958 TaxID=857566 RepID=A0A1E3PD55_9ASCO|nr:hypothetical protein NADFUDRAFT_48186 [Nadsonia fulvescens var. elongata DSM 6958]